jgi:hypothetical protein
MTPKPIKLFKPGTFTSVEGTVVSFGVPELEAIAAAYDPEADQAPIVIGHPKLEDPAYGWVKGLRVEGGTLVADPEQVEPSFAELVNAGRFKKVSAQFYPPKHPVNPKPGEWYLKHVGFLGAAAPGVKGLGKVSFGEGADAAPCFTIEKDTDMPDKEASFAERESALAQREAELNDRAAKLEKEEADRRHADNVSFAEGLVSQAKLAPAGKALLIGVLDALPQADTVSFGEAGDMTPAAALKKLFEGAQPLVSLGEAAGTEKKEPGDVTVVSFAAPSGYTADPEALRLYQKAKAIQAEKPGTSWSDAVQLAQGS